MTPRLPERLATIAAEEAGSLFGAMDNFPFPDVCAVIGVPPLAGGFREPVVSDVPMLFVSVTLDGNTPRPRRQKWPGASDAPFRSEAVSVED